MRQSPVTGTVSPVPLLASKRIKCVSIIKHFMFTIYFFSNLEARLHILDNTKSDASLLSNYERQTYQPTNQLTNRLTNQYTDMWLHREVTFPIIISQYWLLFTNCLFWFLLQQPTWGCESVSGESGLSQSSTIACLSTPSMFGKLACSTMAFVNGCWVGKC